MSLVRLTPDLAELIAGKMGINAQQLREGIVNGKLIGQKYSDRIYMIDEQYVPKDASALPENPQQIRVEVKPDATTEAIDRLIAYTDKQKILCDKYVQLQQMRKQRDLPEILKEREIKLNEREAVAYNLDVSLKEREAKLKAGEAELLDQKLKTSQECAKQLTEVGNKYRLLQQGQDALLKQKQAQLLEIESEITEKQAISDKLDTKLAQYPEVIKPFEDRIRKMVKIAEIVAAKNSQRAEQTSGETSDYYMRKANYAWNISDGLQRVWKWLNA